MRVDVKAVFQKFYVFLNLVFKGSVQTQLDKVAIFNGIFCL